MGKPYILIRDPATGRYIKGTPPGSAPGIRPPEAAAMPPAEANKVVRPPAPPIVAPKAEPVQWTMSVPFDRDWSSSSFSWFEVFALSLLVRFQNAGLTDDSLRASIMKVLALQDYGALRGPDKTVVIGSGDAVQTKTYNREVGLYHLGGQRYFVVFSGLEPLVAGKADWGNLGTKAAITLGTSAGAALSQVAAAGDELLALIQADPRIGTAVQAKQLVFAGHGFYGSVAQYVADKINAAYILAHPNPLNVAPVSQVVTYGAPAVFFDSDASGLYTAYCRVLRIYQVGDTTTELPSWSYYVRTGGKMDNDAWLFNSDVPRHFATKAADASGAPPRALTTWEQVEGFPATFATSTGAKLGDSYATLLRRNYSSLAGTITQLATSMVNGDFPSCNALVNYVAKMEIMCRESRDAPYPIFDDLVGLSRRQELEAALTFGRS